MIENYRGFLIEPHPYKEEFFTVCMPEFKFDVYSADLLSLLSWSTVEQARKYIDGIFRFVNDRQNFESEMFEKYGAEYDDIALMRKDGMDEDAMLFDGGEFMVNEEWRNRVKEIGAKGEKQ